MRRRMYHEERPSHRISRTALEQSLSQRNGRLVRACYPWSRQLVPGQRWSEERPRIRVDRLSSRAGTGYGRSPTIASGPRSPITGEAMHPHSFWSRSPATISNHSPDLHHSPVLGFGRAKIGEDMLASTHPKSGWGDREITPRGSKTYWSIGRSPASIGHAPERRCVSKPQAQA